MAVVAVGVVLSLAAGGDFDDLGGRTDWSTSFMVGFGYLFGASFGWAAGQHVARGDREKT